MHRVSDMLRILTALNLHFPQGGRSPEEMQSLAQDWAEDFAAFPMPVMQQAVKNCRRNQDFFPTTHQMLEYCAKARGDLDRYQQRMALPAPDMTEAANLERGKKQCAAILEKLRLRGFSRAS